MAKDLLDKVLQQAQTPVWLAGVRDGFDIPVETQGNGVLDTNNSTNVALGAGGVFTGQATNVLQYTVIRVSVVADAPSAIDGLELQFSDDGVMWYASDNYTYENDTTLKTWAIQPVLEFFRVVYTNGSVAQTIFDLSVLLQKSAGVTSSHRIADPISGEDDASLTATVIKARNPSTGLYENIIMTPDGGLNVSVVSPLGTLPVSELNTLHDGKILNFIDTRVYETAGTGTGTFTNNKYNMAVTAGQWQIITTRRFAPYYSGKPQKVELTFDHFAPEANVVKRTGYFSSSIVSPYDATLDGLWLESSNGTITIKASRAGVETLSVDIADWTGYSRINNYQNLATWDNFTVIEFNFLWLGGAYIELRIVTDDGFVTAHNFVYAGTSQDTFIKSPNQPIRYEIRSTTGTGDFRYICNQIATAGSISESGYSTSVNNGTATVTYSTAGTKYPILAVRKKTAYRDLTVKLKTLNVFLQSSDRILWTLEINPTLSAALTYADDPSTVFQFANGTGAITVTATGRIIASGYLTLGQSIPTDIFAANYLSELSGQLNGTQDEYVLCITPITTNVNALASMNLQTG